MFIFLCLFVLVGLVFCTREKSTIVQHSVSFVLQYSTKLDRSLYISCNEQGIKERFIMEKETAKENYELLLKANYEKVDELYEQAGKIYEMWVKEVAAREVMRETGYVDNSEKTIYQLNLFTQGAFFRLYWKKVVFFKHGNKTKRIVKHLKTPEKGFHGADSFHLASEWELKIILNVEKNLRPIRNQLKNLSKVHQFILYAAKAGGIDIKPIPIKERKTLSIFTFEELKNIFRAA